MPIAISLSNQSRSGTPRWSHASARIPLVAATSGYLSLFAWIRLADNPSLNALVPVSIVLSVIGTALLLNRKIEFRQVTLWAMVATGFLYLTGLTVTIDGILLSHLSVGIDPIRYDRMLHFVAGVVTVSAITQIRTRGPKVSALAPLVVTALSLGVGVEVAELGLSHLLQGGWIIDAADIAWDVLFDAAGIAAGVALIRRVAIPKRSDDRQRVIWRGSEKPGSKPAVGGLAGVGTAEPHECR